MPPPMPVFPFSTPSAGNSLLDYFLSAGAFSFTLLALLLARFLVQRYARQHPSGDRVTPFTLLLDILARLNTPFLVAIASYHALTYVGLHPTIWRITQFLLLGLILIQILVIAGNLVTFLLPRVWRFPGTEKDPSRTSAITNIAIIIKVTLWIAGFLFLFDNLGFNVTSMIAGLGIGGIAIALAAQSLLKDTFSSFTIYLDRPFGVGDFIAVGDLQGTVERIGLKTTRIRSLTGELLVFSNSDLTESRIRNYERMELRRISFRIGVVPATPLPKLKLIPQLLQKAIETTNDTRFDRAHFFQYGDFSLIYEVVYFVLNPDYGRYMNIQQDINFKIRECFDQHEIQIAVVSYPPAPSPR